MPKLFVMTKGGYWQLTPSTRLIIYAISSSFLIRFYNRVFYTLHDVMTDLVRRVCRSTKHVVGKGDW